MDAHSYLCEALLASSQATSPQAHPVRFEVFKNQNLTFESKFLTQKHLTFNLVEN